MKKGFSLVEIIISISLLSVIFVFSMLIIKKTDTSYADPYEEIRLLISDAANIYLNLNDDKKEKLYSNKKLVINSNELIKEGLIVDNYYLSNINETKDLQNIEIIILIDDEGLINYSINIV